MWWQSDDLAVLAALIDQESTAATPDAGVAVRVIRDVTGRSTQAVWRALSELQRGGLVVVESGSRHDHYRCRRGHPELEALAETLYVHYGVSSTPIIADDVVESGLRDVAPFIRSDFDGATDSRTWFPDHLTAAANVAVLAGDVATGPTAVQARRSAPDRCPCRRTRLRLTRAVTGAHPDRPGSGRGCGRGPGRRSGADRALG